MDLYGDLLSSSNGGLGFVSSGGWANISSDNNSNTTSSNSVEELPKALNANLETRGAMDNAIVAPAVASLMKPTSLSFRPRQTGGTKQKDSLEHHVNVSESNSKKSDTAFKVMDFSRGTDKEHKTNLLEVVQGKFSDVKGTDMKEPDSTISPWIPMGSFDAENAEIVMYDPIHPNDYIAYCQERIEKRRLDKLQEENLKRLEEQEKQREKLIKEKEDAYREGNIAKLQEITSGAGRGRGRGSSNLPAWMMSNNAIENGVPNTLPIPVKSVGQFDDAYPVALPVSPVTTVTSKILMLENMASRHSSDSELQELIADVTYECLTKFGEVKNCFAYVQRYQEPGKVLTFVVFDQLNSAIKAYNELNGRYFDGNEIVGCFYKEGAFLQRDYEQL